MNMLYKLSVSDEEFAKFLKAGGFGSFDYECKFLDNMNEEELEIIRKCGSEIVDAIKTAFIRVYEKKLGKEKLNMNDNVCQCDICGEPFISEDLTENVCDDCYNEYFTEEE